MKHKLFTFILVIASIFALSEVASAQCPMCRLSAETNLKNGGRVGKTLNTGIIYLLIFPYLIVGSIGYYWWKSNHAANTEEIGD